MGKVKDYEILYAIRDKETKKIARATKCKGGSFYKVRNMCNKRCDGLNHAMKLDDKDIEYEVGEYAVIDIDDYKELIRRI